MAALLSATRTVVRPAVVEVSLATSTTAKPLRAQLRVPGGGRHAMYVADSIEEVSDIDPAALKDWLGKWMRDGWALVDVNVPNGRFYVSSTDVEVACVDDHGVVHHYSVDGGAVDATRGNLLLPPLTMRMDADLDVAIIVGIFWSHWFDIDGIGRRRVDAWMVDLEAEGWRLESGSLPSERESEAPHPPHVAPPPLAPPLPLAPPRGGAVDWCALPASTVTIGIDEREGARLAEALVELERRDREAEGSLGFDGFDRERRRQEIAAGLELAVGASREAVAAGEIMRHPVTNAQWQAFMAATGAARPASWGSGAPAPDEFVTGVSWAEADAFARHHGWSLPTEGEWQLAATGGGARRFPWGDEFAPLGAALDRGNVPWRVGQAPALASPLGVEDLLGAFCEYTTGWLRPLAGGDALAFLRATGDDGEQRVARGVAPRVPTCIAARRGVAPEHRFKFARFRCVRR
ncbi:MAG: SUMF1/EgtB/PvdO family nonheme iron enzyme [Kofleriaceae bacterium]